MALLATAFPTSGGDHVFSAVSRGIPSFGDLAWKAPVRVAQAASLPANTYGSGVLTANANGALPHIDAATMIVGDRVLIWRQSSFSTNGVYVVTDLGSAGTPWRLTRASDCDSAAEMVAGTAFYVADGDVNAQTVWAAGAAWAPTSGNPEFTRLTDQLGNFGRLFRGPLASAASEIEVRAGTGSTAALLLGDDNVGAVASVGWSAATALFVDGSATGLWAQFPAAQVASSDPNTLDDYEEGTWTPVPTFTTPGTLNFVGTTSGTYVKIGGLVSLSFSITSTTWNLGNAAGAFRITGMPFTPSQTGYGTGRFEGWTLANVSNLSVVATGAATFLGIQYSRSGAVGGSLAIGQFTTGTQIQINANVLYSV